MSVLSKTLKDAGFSDIFKEVEHTESLGLLNPTQLRIFHLAVSNNAFSFDAMHNFLLKNIGRYVFSRARIDQFRLDDEEDVIGLKAVELLRKAALSADWINEKLGDILLYAFLEQILEAPKIYSKVELLKNGNQGIKNGGGVHLLAPGDGIPSYQIVFGKSHIVDDIEDAINNAFELINVLKKDEQNEMQLIENTILNYQIDKDTADFLKGIIIPSRNKGTTVDKSFGVFLGYKLGLDPAVYPRDEFLKQVTIKMQTDIKNHVAYIIKKIKDTGLESYSFYFYILPFNDAVAEKAHIMNALLGGGEQHG